MAQPRDYYEVLGVSKTATPDDLKRAYRNLAKKYHPDTNRAADAADRFREIQDAYDLLSDENKRRQYDRYGHAAAGNGAQYGEGFAASGFSDIFDMFFGGQQARGQTAPNVVRGDDLREDLEMTLEEAATGVEKVIRFHRMETCDTCQGSGAKVGTQVDTCPQCRGTGQISFSQNTILGMLHQQQTCNKCRGTGRIIADPCETCRSTGRVRRVRERGVKIPAGADTGMRVRLVGEGDAGERGGPYGDLYLVLHVQEHEYFERQGNDLICEIPVSFVQAALGDVIQVHTIGGAEELRIPEGTQPGHVITLRGKGIPDINGRGKGDQKVIVKIEVPTKLNGEQRELLKQFAVASGERTPDRAENKSFLGRILGHQG